MKSIAALTFFAALFASASATPASSLSLPHTIAVGVTAIPQCASTGSLCLNTTGAGVEKLLGLGVSIANIQALACCNGGHCGDLDPITLIGKCH